MEFGDSVLPQLFWEKVKIREDGCWEWTGTITSHGYGLYNTQSVHRMVVLAFGPIRQGFVVDHTCHNPAYCAGGDQCPHRRCCNPAHLEAVTHAENVRRGCANGSNYPAAIAAECLRMEGKLTEWREVVEQRDDLVCATHREAGVTKSRIHNLTGIGRATIDRILEKS